MLKFFTAFLLGLQFCGAQALQSPSEFLGYELGTQFTRHHEVKAYFEYLQSQNSNRMQLEVYGQTYERRPLLLATLSSEANMNNLETIKKEHLKSTTSTAFKNDIAIVWLSYNVHGNESVSTESAMQTAYELLTSKSHYLDNTVVLIDPCINPDGRERYVNFYYENKNTPNQVDPNSKEHHEGWLSGRANHYMFDLNRDWAWLTQVESQQRLKKYNQWLPHVHVDFHEQGVDEPYYFAPAAKPYHNAITDFQSDFQVEIGKNHARYFDKNNWFYFTKEIFDLFYPSYGDTYPVFNGAVGMTYEQGGSGDAGLAIKTAVGDTLTLKDRILHHHTTGLSTVEVASKNASRLNAEFSKFYNANTPKYETYVMSGNADKISNLVKLLKQHNIEYGQTSETDIKGYNYQTSKNESVPVSSENLVISTNQVKGTLVDVLFQPNSELEDSLTYDITAWSLPYAHGLNAVAVKSAVSTTPFSLKDNTTVLDENAYAYVTDWNSFTDARFLASLLNKGVRVRFSEVPFTVEGQSYNRGSLIIAKADNLNHETFKNDVQSSASSFNKAVQSVSTGFVESGKDFGSSAVKMIPKQKIALVSGGSISTLQFGELWHFFEQQLNYPVSVLDMDYINRVDLSTYDVLVLPGSYGELLNDKQIDKISDWVFAGGRLIVMEHTISNFVGKPGFKVEVNKLPTDSLPDKTPFDKLQRSNISNTISGAIFKTKVDTTHPMAFGYTNDTYFTLKLGAISVKQLKNGNVVYIDDETKPVSGFAGYKAQDVIKNSLVFGVEQMGRGEVVYMVDNPLFRGFWDNGKLFFVNALFMVN